MDFNDTPQEAAFRAEIREWIASNGDRFVPAQSASDDEVFQVARKWQAALADAGLAGFGLPKEIGGRPGGPMEKVIFQQEIAGHPMSRVEALGMVGIVVPTILAHGTPEQVDTLVRPTIRGDLVWCQLFSEPGAGSDLAGIRTSAVPHDGGWLVNGQKVWTSGAQNADYAVILTRTDPSRPKHAGLTYFLIDMHAPGVDVRPLKQISGRSEFNEVFFTNVYVSDAMRMGPVNGGWAVAISTLSNESLALTGNAGVSRNLIQPLIRFAKRTRGRGGRLLIEDTAFREKIAAYQVAVAGIDHIASRISTALSRGQNPGSEMYIGKMTLTRLLQSMSEFGMNMAGMAGGVVDRETDPDLFEVQQGFLLAPGYRMGGGTEEIGKNIIAERVLGLPGEYRPDKDVPFNQIA